MSVLNAKPDTSGAADLSGKTAVVTGSSSGIGRAIAVQLAAGGAAVVVHGATNRAGIEETRRIIDHAGRSSIGLLADLADISQHEQFVDQAWNWHGEVDIWINNAGVDVLTGEHAAWTFDEKLNRLWQVDVMATVRLSRIVGARMKSKQGPAGSRVILNMGWDQAERGMEGDSGEMFTTVKGAVMAFTRSLAKSLAPEVRVNCLAPGWIRTSWGEEASSYWQERACDESLLRRWGAPEDVARVASFLASPAASFITGQIVPINGGMK